MCDLCRHKRIKCELGADEEDSDRGSSPAPPKAGATPARRGTRRKKPAAKVVEGEGARAAKEDGGGAAKRSVAFASSAGKGRATTQGKS